MTLSDFLSDMRDYDKPLKYSALLQVSGLTTEEVDQFKEAWGAVSPARKDALIGMLVGLDEDNPEVDFAGVFRTGLEDEDVGVRLKSIQGLWECDDRAIIRPLLRLLADDLSSDVRAAAAASLGRFGALAQEGKLLSRYSDRIRDGLMFAIGREREDVMVRRKAIEAVSYLDFPGRDQLIDEVYSSGDPGFQQSAVYAMGLSSNDRWLPTVVREMENDSAAIRYEAAVAGGKLGDETTVPDVAELIEDEDPQVQLAAIEALGVIGGSAAKRALLGSLEMGDETLEQAARDAIEEIEFDDDPLGLRFDS